ncbi:MAG: hypothetical protein AAF581_14170 [Planctomycetota bacterium]
MPRAWILACNRSGSTLLLEVLRRLTQATVPDAPATTATARAEFDEAIESWQARLAPVTFSSTGCTNLGTIDFIAARHGADHEFTFVTHLPIARDPFDVVHACYTYPTAAAVAYCQQAPRFAPVRHPLDILVSHAFEYEHVLLEMHNDAQIDPEYREQYGHARLASVDWVRGAGRYIAGFYAELLQRGRAIHTVRYEDFLDDASSTIQDLANLVGAELDTTAAAALWDEVGFRPLRQNSAHLFRPGSGKWREYLDRSHLAALAATGLDHVTRELGYEWPTDLRHSVGSTGATTARLEFDLAVGDAMNHLMFATPVAFTDDAIEFLPLAGHGANTRAIVSGAPLRDLLLDLQA